MTMIDQETRKAAMFEAGKTAALALQEKSSTMDGTQLNDSTGDIPDFQAAKAAKNMLERTAGKENGFVCKSSAGRVVRLLQKYDSDTYPEEPEQLPAQWRFVWSKDPKHALPFVSLATSPFNTGEVCSVDGVVYRSNHDGNVWSPATNPEYWDKVDLDTWEPPVVEPEEPVPSPDPEQPDGTLENPITAERGMTYEYGKYYLDPEDGKTYLCKRQNETGTIKLDYLPHELILHYFVEA